VAFNFTLDTWVSFKVFGLTALMLVFSVSSILMLYKYLPQDEENKSQKETLENESNNN
jgi:intracellular septation protein